MQQKKRELLYAFISSGLDYCNSLQYGIIEGLLQNLQAVQKAGARLGTETGKFEHITLVLRELRWLPVWQRIIHKLAMTAYKCLYVMEHRRPT